MKISCSLPEHEIGTEIEIERTICKFPPKSCHVFETFDSERRRKLRNLTIF